MSQQKGLADGWLHQCGAEVVGYGVRDFKDEDLLHEPQRVRSGGQLIDTDGVAGIRTV